MYLWICIFSYWLDAFTWISNGYLTCNIFKAKHLSFSRLCSLPCLHSDGTAIHSIAQAKTENHPWLVLTISPSERTVSSTSKTVLSLPTSFLSFPCHRSLPGLLCVLQTAMCILPSGSPVLHMECSSLQFCHSFRHVPKTLVQMWLTP